MAAHTEVTEQLRSVVIYDLDNSWVWSLKLLTFYVIIFYHMELEVIEIGIMWMALICHGDRKMTISATKSVRNNILCH